MATRGKSGRGWLGMGLAGLLLVGAAGGGPGPAEPGASTVRVQLGGETMGLAVRAEAGQVWLQLAGSPAGWSYEVWGCTNLSQAGGWRWLGTLGLGSNSMVGHAHWPWVFYRLARGVDQDGDGLSDAWEEQVSQTSVGQRDSDGDGVEDGTEWWQGRDPRVSGAVVDTGGRVRLEVYTPLE